MAITYSYEGARRYGYLDRPWERAMRAARDIAGYEERGANRLEVDDDGKGRVVYYEGAVLATGERNYYDDSDFYAVVWDGEKVTSTEYATTRFGGGGNAVVDATDEVKEAASDYIENWYYGILKEAAKRDAKRVEKGKRVRVIKGRKAPIGAEGEVIWAAERRYGGVTRSSFGKTWSGGGTKALRIGIATDDEMETIEKTGRKGKKYTVERHKNVVWTYGHNVEVIDPENYEPSDDEIRERAKRARGNYRAINSYYSARAGMIAL